MLLASIRAGRLRSLALLTTVLLALGACDSSDFSETNVDGQYTITALTFDPQPAALANVNVLSRLDAGSTSMTFAGSSRSYVLAFRFTGEASQYLVSGRYSTSGSSGVVVSFSGTDRRRLLLPAEATFRFDEAAVLLRVVLGEVDVGERPLIGQRAGGLNAVDGTLTYQGPLTNVNLAEYDPQQYGGLNAVDGTLTFTLRRR
jgi:hypothetical protein